MSLCLMFMQNDFALGYNFTASRLKTAVKIIGGLLELPVPGPVKEIQSTDPKQEKLYGE